MSTVKIEKGKRNNYLKHIKDSDSGVEDIFLRTGIYLHQPTTYLRFHKICCLNATEKKEGKTPTFVLQNK